MSEGYRTFDHTGDLGLEAWAATPERLYAIAAEAVLAQVADARSTEPDGQVRLELTGDDPADLLVHWLNTALLQADLNRSVWTRARVESLTRHALTGVLEGPVLDPSRHVLLREIKAVSHHYLELELAGPVCRCRLILDI
jgi:SHS2 domain-containing protein